MIDLQVVHCTFIARFYSYLSHKVHAFRRLSDMPRAPIPSGGTRNVAVVPLGYDVSDDDQREVTVPRSTTDSGEKWTPKGTKVGRSVEVETPDGVREYIVTRWRGLARLVDAGPIRLDDRQLSSQTASRRSPPIMIRRWASTKAAAEEATKRAAHHKLDDLECVRQADRQADGRPRGRPAALEAANAPDPTTVEICWDGRASDPRPFPTGCTSPRKTATRRSSAHCSGEPLRPIRGGRVRPRSPERLAMAQAFEPVAAMRPADVDARTLKTSCAGFRHERQGTSDQDPVRPGAHLGSRDGRPQAQHSGRRRVRPPRHRVESSDPGSDKARDWLTRSMPHDDGTDPDRRACLRPGGGTNDPGRRNKSSTGRRDKEANGKDIRDLVSLLFFTGARQGELLALRCSDVVLDGDDPHITINVTLTYTPGQPLRRNPADPPGHAQHLPRPAGCHDAQGARGALPDGRDGNSPVFGSPQHPDRLRDPNNLNRSIRNIFNRHGVDVGVHTSSRSCVVNHLLQQHVPLPEITRWMGGLMCRGSKYADAIGEVGSAARRDGTHRKR